MKLRVALALLISFSLFAKDNKGAEYRTIETFQYGRFEVRYKASWGSGQTSTFFLYNDDYPNTPWNEIDIEILGHYRDDVQFNTITPGSSHHVRHQNVNFDPRLDFHTYAIEWTPEYVAWFVDGDEVARQTGPHIAAIEHPMKVMMNIWNPDNIGWVGEWNPEMLPFFAYYDFVTVASYTPGAGDMGTGRNFTRLWTDDFDQWDQTRWQKATHTWPGNRCDFLPDNIVFLDGLMVLCLTDNDQTGYVDGVPPSPLWARHDGQTVTLQFSEEVDEAAAQTVSNYTIPGAAIQRATLLADGRTVKLQADDLPAGQNTIAAVLNIPDLADPPNDMSAQVVNILAAQPLDLPIRINAGSDISGDWLADEEWGHDAEHGRQDGWRSVNTAEPIAGTEEEGVYQSQRMGLATYRVRVPDGDYRVTLHFAELEEIEAGTRVFDLFAENEKQITALDVAQEAGRFTAVTRILDPIAVQDGVLDLHFSALSGEPSINGIEIEPASTAVSNNEIPDHFLLTRSYPNPFNSRARIAFQLPASGRVKLSLFNTRGETVATLVDGMMTSGRHEITWDADVPSGVYFYRIRWEHGNACGKMILMK